MIKKKLDIIVPVYNEGSSILNIIRAFNLSVKTPHNILICYDHENDTSVINIKKFCKKEENIFFVKNKYIGAHGAVMSGIEKSASNYVLVMPADDDYNQNIIDKIVDLAITHNIHVVSPCRFTKNSKIENGPFFKFLLEGWFNLYRL